MSVDFTDIIFNNFSGNGLTDPEINKIEVSENELDDFVLNEIRWEKKPKNLLDEAFTQACESSNDPFRDFVLDDSFFSSILTDSSEKFVENTENAVSPDSAIPNSPTSSVTSSTSSKSTTSRKVRYEVKSFKQFKCDVDNCDWSFDRLDELERHRLTHSDERPHACDRCPKRFKRKDHLQTHLKAHDNIKDFHCHFVHPNGKRCGSSFVRSDELKNHLKVHWKTHPDFENKVPQSVTPMKSVSNQVRGNLRNHVNRANRSHPYRKPMNRPSTAINQITNHQNNCFRPSPVRFIPFSVPTELRFLPHPPILPQQFLPSPNLPPQIRPSQILPPQISPQFMHLRKIPPFKFEQPQQIQNRPIPQQPSKVPNQNYNQNKTRF